MAKSFGWSLRDIDETDIESLLRFVFRLTDEGARGAPQQVFCDQVSWL